MQTEKIGLCYVSCLKLLNKKIGGILYEKQRIGCNRPSKLHHEKIQRDYWKVNEAIDWAIQNIFTKSKSNALTNEAFAAFIQEQGITEFYIAGADATACIKSTCFNMKKSEYTVHVLSDCITSYDKKKLPEMLAYYESKGCEVLTFQEVVQA